jgi:glycopeptide antibiotics resistance protein
MRELKPEYVRPMLGLLSIVATAIVIYASLVPLNYAPLPWPETVARFKEIPWFQLGIDRRADWVANGLIMLPAGFFAAAAIDWKRRRRWALLLAAPLIIATLIAIVLAIEFAQLWFPPRVTSQNDILAGMIGSIGGVGLWAIVGHSAVDRFVQFWLCKPGLRRWQLLMEYSVIGLLLYNLMPLDVMLSAEEFQAKHQTRPLTLIPFADFNLDKESIANAVVDLARLMPFAFFSTLSYGSRRAVLLAAVWACCLESVKIPLYSRVFSVTDIFLTMTGATLATVLAPAMLRTTRRLDLGWTWFLAALGWSGIMLVGFLSRYESIVRDPQLIQERWQGILIVPFARAHSSSEMEAGENILVKLMLFAALSFLLCSWCSRISAGLRTAAVIVATLWFLILSVAIEVGQVFLYPLVPDVTDFIIYSLGAICGTIAFRMMIPNNYVMFDDMPDLTAPRRK